MDLNPEEMMSTTDMQRLLANEGGNEVLSPALPHDPPAAAPVAVETTEANKDILNKKTARIPRRRKNSNLYILFFWALGGLHV